MNQVSGNEGPTSADELAENKATSCPKPRATELAETKGHKDTPMKIPHEEGTQPFPENLNTPEFQAAWNGWNAYRKEAGLKAWIPRTASAQLARLSGLGAARAVAAINHSIQQGWQGIYEPKHAAAGRTGPHFK